MQDRKLTNSKFNYLHCLFFLILSDERETDKGTKLYEPYDFVTPYFRWKAQMQVNDAEWNRVRAGTCIGDLVLDLINNRTLRLGHTDANGVRHVDIKVVNEPYVRRWHNMGHHDIHTPGSVTESPLMVITTQGEYKQALLGGRTVTHYLPEKHAAFVIAPIIDLVEDLSMKVEQFDVEAKNVVKILNNANQVGAEAFEPEIIEIGEGDAIKWVNQEQISSHILCNGTWRKPKEMGSTWISPMLKPQSVYYRKFDKAGTYEYSSATYRKIGKIIVKPKGVPEPPPSDSKETDRELIDKLRKRGWSWQKILDFFEARRRRKRVP